MGFGKFSSVFKAPDRLPFQQMNEKKLFSDIIGHQPIKEAFNMFLKANESTSVLMTGAPATSKTLFLLSMMRYCRNSYFVDASNATRAGLLDQLFGAKSGTEVLLLDEIDGLKKPDQKSLLNLAETGLLVSTKVGKQRTRQFNNLKIFATCNVQDKLIPELKSRFVRIYLQEYTYDEFIDIAVQMYPAKDRELCEYVAKAVMEVLGSKDIRDYQKIIKHSKNVTDADKLIELQIKYGDKDRLPNQQQQEEYE